MNRAPTRFDRDDTGRLLVFLDRWVNSKRQPGSGWTAEERFEAPIPGVVFRDHDRLAASQHGPNAKRITMALDARGLDGPEIDEALGVLEPTVDLWETGTIVPSKEDVARLAMLTHYPPAFFYQDDPAPVGPGWFCTSGDGCFPMDEFPTGPASLPDLLQGVPGVNPEQGRTDK